ncbi:uncharacterized protein LOC126822187 isoform X2 [Patella vulgata]|uniref:uncharacterized protein LOC126822187 isoform X2 n=1 Tax=Patella vulgata TaxID=6465 RepID=UPI0024A8AAB2|nr:uncharacterized protein LOC126822187 isoform X2 [Patella vulgata]
MFVFIGNKDDALPVYGYHSKCYSRFTDRTKIERATKSVALQSGEKQTSDESPSTSRQGLRSAATKLSTTQAVHLRGHVLPPVCIICKKVPLFYRCQKKTVSDKLVLAETKDGGRLREAAIKKEDETILRHIRDKDCVAVEVRYHLRCYKDYVRFLTRKPTVQSSGSSEVSAYEKTFDIFCEDVIRKRIIFNKVILRMAKLLDMFIKMAKDIEQVDISNYRAFHLKKRLQSKFPQLVFYSSSKTIKIESSEVTCSTTETGTDAEPVNVNRYRDQNQLHTLYTAAMHLRQGLDKTDGLKGPWPRTVKDLSAEAAKALIPIPLFNIVAWILGISDEPTLDNFVTVNESSKLTSIIQNLIYLYSHMVKSKHRNQFALV